MSGGILNPEVFSAKIRDEFLTKMKLEEILRANPIVLTLGPNIGLTAEQVNDAIRDEATDPIIRNALIAYKTKLRIADTPPDKIRVGKIYGYGAIKP